MAGLNPFYGVIPAFKNQVPSGTGFWRWLRPRKRGSNPLFWVHVWSFNAWTLVSALKSVVCVWDDMWNQNSSFLCNGFLRDSIKAKPVVAMFAIYLLSGVKRMKDIYGNHGNQGFCLYILKNPFHMNFTKRLNVDNSIFWVIHRLGGSKIYAGRSKIYGGGT